MELSRMNCYAGKWQAKVLAFTPDIDDETGVYLDMVEGCGSMPFTLTTKEARELAQMLLDGADESEREFNETPINP